MNPRLAALVFLLSVPVFLRAQAPERLPILDGKPTPRVDALGPSAAVTTLAFDADGKTLYAAGLDKLLRVWKLDKGTFVRDKAVYRVPIGPENGGAINAVALSPDGKWVAMAGRAPRRGEAGFRIEGVKVDAENLSVEQHRDLGVIYLANVANPAAGKVLRGHRGEVRALQFVPSGKDGAPLLLSTATERDGKRRYGGLRLWDVNAEKTLAQRDDLPAHTFPPGLAVWRIGPAPTQIRAAVLWLEEDPKKGSFFRLWEPDAEKPLRAWDSDPASIPAALIPDADDARVLVGGAGRTSGRLRTWRFSAGPLPAPGVSDNVEFPPSAGLPVVTAVYGDDRKPTRAAVILRPLSLGDYRLALIDLETSRMLVSIPIPDSNYRQLPVLACRGPFLALAATRDHAVQVFRLSDLEAGKAEPIARLDSGALQPKRVAFVDGGKLLWLDTKPAGDRLTGGWVVDLMRRKVQANADPLKSDAPEMGAWSFAIAEDKKSVQVRNGDKTSPPVRLTGKDEVITAVALRPPEPGRSGVLAVAYTERNASRTLILLCNPVDGKAYRLLTGHLQEVRDLAFSASRPLLASVADDQTVCVWSLTKFDRVIGQVPGLVVQDDRGKVVVRGVGAESTLAEGDVLEKLRLPGGEAKVIPSAAHFLYDVSALAPGATVEVTVAGKGVMKLPVGRGVGEGKPLFTLFLLAGDKSPEWVGWNPAGPYDASGPATEAILSWHTNTGKAGQPTENEPAINHKKEYWREGILGYLSAEADLDKALRKWDVDHPPPPPKASLRLIPPPGLEWVGAYRTRQPILAVRLTVQYDDGSPVDERHVLRWQMQDGKYTGQARRIGEEWEVDLRGVEWRRGESVLRMQLFPNSDSKAVRGSLESKFAFRPPAPKLSLSIDAKPVRTTESKPLEVKDKALAVQVGVTAPKSQTVAVRFGHALNGTPITNVPAPRERTDTAAFEQTFQLAEGLNRLTVRASNQGADSADEEAIDTLWVRYRGKELPPSFSRLRVDPEPEVKRGAEEEVWVVSRPKATLSATVEGKGTLTRADWSVDGSSPRSVLGAGERNTADFSIALDLTAGKRTTVQLRAQSQRSDAGSVSQVIVFHPTLPIVHVDPLNSPDVFTERVALSGSYSAETNDPFSVVLLVTSLDGKTGLFTPTVDEKARRWTANINLVPGENRIAARIGNRWRGERTTDTVLTLTYRRPPRITETPKEVVARGVNKVPLTITVEGPSDRPLRSMLVDGVPVAFKVGEPMRAEGRSAWKVELPEVFVHDGERELKQISMRALTDEGESDTAVISVTHLPIPVSPPVVSFLNPRGSTTTREPTVTVRFRVESERPLESVRILRGTETVFTADPKKAEREGKRHVIQGDAEVSLIPGVNVLELVSVSGGVRSLRETVEIGYVRPGVLVLVDAVERRDEKDEVIQTLRSKVSRTGAVSFPAASGSLVWLVGRVRWSDPNAAALDKPNLEVEVKVGDCRQFPTALGPRGKGDAANIRPFRVPVVLIGEENHVSIRVPTVGQQERSIQEVQLACTAPARQQRLHVLIVGVDVAEPMELKKRVLDALGVGAGERPPGYQGEFFKKPPFERCVLYYVLTGEVDRSKVEAQLVEINREILRLKRDTGWLNDLVLIYYQGEDVEVPSKRERWLKTSANLQFPKVRPERYAIPCHELPRVPGAQLLLLNVSGPPGAGDPGTRWAGDQNVGFLRYACSDPAEVRRPDPSLLSLLQEAVGKKGRLGDVRDYVNELIARQPGKIAPLVVLDQDQASRVISARPR
jgi:WD40 repeat protein